MSQLKEVLRNEMKDFREKGHQFVNGELNMMQFKHVSGGFGVYAHKGGKEFMIRLRIPSGMLTFDQLNTVYNLATKYHMERIHLTTRQAIQLHGLSIDEVCDLMEEALDHDIYTRGAGGNFPRNVAISPLSGVNPLEAFDVTPYAWAAGDYFLKQIYTYHLPRKLKVSFSSSNADEGHCTVLDLGFLAVTQEGQHYFEVYLGGGLGQNPRLAVKYPTLINPNDVLYHLEAMVNLFKAEGDYENRNKARVRYIVERMGEEAFIEAYQKHLDEAKNKGGLELNITPQEIHKIGCECDVESKRLFAQKQEGLYSVYLHPIGGQLEVADLKKILDYLANIEGVDIRLAMTEGVYFRNLTGKEAKGLLELTESMGGDTPFEHSVACIGIPTCQIGLCNSQGVLKQTMEYFKEKQCKTEVLPAVHFSGCGNSCGVHQISGIGFTGKKKKVGATVEECFTLWIGGKYEVGKTRLGEVFGEIQKTRIPEFLYELALLVEESGLDFESYIKQNEEQLKEITQKYLV